jgi:hypothetical protein
MQRINQTVPGRLGIRLSALRAASVRHSAAAATILSSRTASPPAFAQQIVTQRASRTLQFLRRRRARLNSTHGAHAPAAVEREREELVRARRQGSCLWAALDSCGAPLPFQASCALVQGRLVRLMRCARGPATAFLARPLSSPASRSLRRRRTFAEAH